MSAARITDRFSLRPCGFGKDTSFSAQRPNSAGTLTFFNWLSLVSPFAHTFCASTISSVVAAGKTAFASSRKPTTVSIWYFTKLRNRLCIPSTTIERVGSQYVNLSNSDHRTPVLLKIWFCSVFEVAANHSSAIALYVCLSRRTQVYIIGGVSIDCCL